MSVSILNSFIDTNTILAISSEPDGSTILGNLLQMICLAFNDPEGCVRFNPHSSMDPESFSRYFNCAVGMVIKSIDALQKFHVLTVEDGKMYINLIREQRMKKTAALQKEAKAAEARAKGAARTAMCRANKKAADAAGEKKSETAPDKKFKNIATENGNEPVTENNSKPVTEPSSENHKKPLEKNSQTRAATHVAKTKNKTCNAKCNAASGKGTPHNYNYNNYNKQDNKNYNYPNYDNYNYADAGKNNPPVTDKGSPHAPKTETQKNPPVPAEKTGSSCLPFCPGDHVDESQLIPLEMMPVQAQHVLDAWNKLKLKPFKGLYSALAEKFFDILYNYGEEAFLKVIENIKNSPFLMGRTNTPNNWCATFTWLLKLKNFLNVLNGKYNRNSGGSACYDAGKTYTGKTYTDGNRNDIPSNIPGCENWANMTPKERHQAYYEYMHPHNELLDEMARDFGVSY